MAEKTVKQLQAEYAKISEENRKAYDYLKGYGTGSGVLSWQNEYSRLIAKTNPTAKEQARIAELKPKFEAAQAKYKQTQEAKNAAKKALEDAQKAASKGTEEAAAKKSAQAAYDKALSALNVATAELGGYQGKEGYTAAYQKAQQAAAALTKAGGTPNLPALAAGITLPTIGADGKPITTETDTANKPNPSVKELLDKLTAPGNEDILKQYQVALAKNFGYKGNVEGKADAGFRPALETALQTRGTLPTAWQGTDFQSFLFKPTVTLSASGGTTTGPDKTTIRSYTVRFDKTQAESAINKMFQSELGRDMTDEEFKTIWDKLDAAQKANPTKYRVVSDASGYITKDSKQTGGLDVDQFIKDQFKSGADGKLPSLKQEYANVKVQAPELTKLAANKKLYESVLGATPTLESKMKASETTAYGRGLKELNTQIADYVMNQGATNTPEEIAAIAQDLYDKGYDLSSETGMSQLQGALKFEPSATGTYTGKAGTAIADLAATAMANGLDLNKTFGGKLQGWLSAINHGEPIDNIKQQIREVAKIGMPDNVKKLIDNGMDLESIYSPYKQTMASVLELSPEAISLSDPTLRAAITGQGEVPLYDFERALRKDDRWQYTNQARSEVSSAAQKVLQDFGFMG
jgi:hypothetical protein